MIVDTSVVVDALVPGSLSAAAREFLLRSSDLRAPDLLAVEIAGALTRAVRRGDISEEFARSAHRASPQLLPALEATAPLLDRSFSLSLELAHPLYDCVFLALAEARATTLVSSDRRFTDKLKCSPHKRAVTHLSDWE
ncbi:MAG: type toxin-antitoxin system VapC family toxin [Microvirga sp.]|jgi:predicted nucleic acid-binding protein|nr:type toxin-antitoxin system VapC family toxin [Microvirga sp.]